MVTSDSALEEMLERLQAQAKQDIYYNVPQLKALLVDANEGYHVWGRGTGKSSGPMADVTVRDVVDMPRSTHIVVGATYQQLLTRTLPSLIGGLEKLGYKKDEHYLIGKKPPRSWKWKEPFEPPVRYDYFVPFWNGSGLHLVSQDIKGSANGINADTVKGDEAKYLHWQKFNDEILPTVRANTQRYGHLSNHQRIFFTTSMPTAAQAKWILGKREEMDAQQVDTITALSLEVVKLQQAYPAASRTRQQAIVREIKKISAYLATLRKDCVHYSEASTLDNLSVLGLEYIKKMKRVMPDFIFETEILNKRPDAIEGGFYPLLGPQHEYASFDNSYLENQDYQFEKLEVPDCRQDADCVRSLPLRLAVDWGGKISCLSVAQHVGNEYRFIKNFYVMHPQLIDDLAREFDGYYKYHPVKDLIFIRDSAWGNARKPDSLLNYNQQFVGKLRELGWAVREIELGVPPDDMSRYLLWYKLLQERDPRLPRIRFNTYNCKEMLTSMHQAPVKQGKYGQIEKDKGSEKGGGPQQDATHFSDTGDQHVISIDKFILREQINFHDIIS